MCIQCTLDDMMNQGDGTESPATENTEAAAKVADAIRNALGEDANATVIAVDFSEPFLTAHELEVIAASLLGFVAQNITARRLAGKADLTDVIAATRIVRTASKLQDVAEDMKAGKTRGLFVAPF